MFELIMDAFSFWLSILFTVWVVTAYGRSILYKFEYDYSSSWSKKKLRLKSKLTSYLPLSQIIQRLYRPKIPSFHDHHNDNDEEDALIGFT
ncbi:putative ATPase [Bacillus sp. TS-2]|nr:putative ATPase [Bacillus sp. TS-2]